MKDMAGAAAAAEWGDTIERDRRLQQLTVSSELVLLPPAPKGKLHRVDPTFAS